MMDKEERGRQCLFDTIVLLRKTAQGQVRTTCRKNNTDVLVKNPKKSLFG